MRIDDLGEKEKRRDEEVRELLREVEIVKKESESTEAINSQLAAERESLIKAADKIVDANAEIEKEIEDILRFDEAIKQSLEIRDRKLSPVIHKTK